VLQVSRLLKNRRARNALKLLVVALGMIWCGSGPMIDFVPHRSASAVAADEALFDYALALARALRPHEAAALLSGLAEREGRPERRVALCSWLAWCAQLSGQLDEQVRACERGLAAVPHEPSLTSILAGALLARRRPGDVTRAAALLSAAIRRHPDPGPDQRLAVYDVHRMLASVRFVQGDVVSARRALDDAYRVSPWSARPTPALAGVQRAKRASDSRMERTGL
jgi:hypothetical protein